MFMQNVGQTKCIMGNVKIANSLFDNTIKVDFRFYVIRYNSSILRI